MVQRSGANSPASQADVHRAFLTVEAALRSEDWFLDAVRAELARKAPLTDYETVTPGPWQFSHCTFCRPGVFTASV